MRTPRLANLVSVLSLVALTAGCLEHPLKEVELEKSSELSKPLDLDDNRDVDILFVIDNSGSMAEEQARLARNFPAFVRRLEAMKADYRIVTTTTDVRHPMCKGGSPEDGDPVLRSCVDAVADGAFVFNDIDASYACTDHCKLSPAELAVQPSLDPDRVLRAHPWLESIAGATNLPAGVAVADAFACYGPQGLDGCAYESPLEAMRLAIDKGREAGGFVREEAILSVVVVTDEADCSSNPAHDAAFTSEPTFWNPEAPQRTSAICWRAGVACDGPGPVYGECHAADHDVDGEPGAAAEDAVLHPVGRYVEFLRGIEAADPAAAAADGQPNPRAVLLSLITGVPAGYDQGEAEIPYCDAEPGSEQAVNFGVAPGCVAEDGLGGSAVPPVREREVAEAFAAEGERNLFSICQDDYSPALEQIAAQLEREFKPVCGNGCYADADAETPALEPDCKVTRTLDGTTSELRPCVRAGDDWAPAGGEEVCFVLLTDPDGRTEDPLDDMTVPPGAEAATCADDETNLEFVLRRSGPRRPGATYEATCALAADQRACERD
jgi:hypothetical protein